MSKILIVDDEAIITAQVKEYLTSMGYKVLKCASSGEQAIELARELRPDLILMDIVMSNNEMDGIIAAKNIKEELDIPIIFMTAYGGDKIIQETKDVDPYGFLEKPFQQNELKTTIEVALYRKDMERRLRESEEKYRSVVDSAIEAIMTIDIHMHIFFWNHAAETMFGYTIDEAKSRHFTFIIPERLRKKVQNEMERMVLTEEDYAGAKTNECIGLRKDGTEFPMEFSLASWIVKETIYFTIIARDITERKKIEQMKSDFVSLVSHQLKTPIAGITGCIDNMLSGLTGSLNEKQIEYLQIMHELSSRSYRIISDLLNISRIERGIISIEILPHNLNDIIYTAIREHEKYIEKKGLKLNINNMDDNITVLSDRDKLFEALSNVIDNAIKFTEKGSITISTKKDDKYGLIDIIDTGKGIPENQLNNLFQKDQIFSGAPKAKSGAGLGLYIAKEFMKLQNGDVRITSSIGMGCRVSFKIPLFKKKVRRKNGKNT
ncbi:PAS domain S-box protein [bacterium]|nr:PAS domain S-box protein [bacterium]RQV95996.1 MAG: PAS domain S-box protein [bacterium]